MRISVNCSRKGLVALPSNRSSSSAVHRPSFGRGCTSRSYSAEVSPDRSTLRTVFRDTLRSRAISLIVLPLRKCSRRIRPIVSTVSIPPTARSESKRAAQQANLQGVNFGRRSPGSGGQNCTPNYTHALERTYVRHHLQNATEKRILIKVIQEETLLRKLATPLSVAFVVQ